MDELLLLDIEASKIGREPDYALIEEIAGECFMPLTYGGGITTVDQAQKLFALGVEKLSLQKSVLQDLNLVNEIAALYGSQSVVVSIDIKKNLLGQYKLYDASTEKALNKDWLDFMKKAVKAGAGEILLTAVDKDGTLSGMDLPLIKHASTFCGVPLITAGGVGSLLDIKAAVDSGASAVAGGAFFVYHGPHRAVLLTYPSYNNLVELLEEKHDD